MMLKVTLVSAIVLLSAVQVLAKFSYCPPCGHCADGSPGKPLWPEGERFGKLCPVCECNFDDDDTDAMTDDSYDDDQPYMRVPRAFKWFPFNWGRKISDKVGTFLTPFWSMPNMLGPSRTDKNYPAYANNPWYRFAMTGHWPQPYKPQWKSRYPNAPPVVW